MAGGVYKRPKLNIFGFSFCPRGPGLESRSLDNKGPGLTAQGTWTRGAGTFVTIFTTPGGSRVNQHDGRTSDGLEIKEKESTLRFQDDVVAYKYD